MKFKVIFSKLQEETDYLYAHNLETVNNCFWKGIGKHLWQKKRIKEF